MTTIDLTELRVNQLGIVLMVLAAVAASAHRLLSLILLGFLALVVLVGALREDLALFKQLYRRILVRRGWSRPVTADGYPEAHRFTEFVAGVVLVLASLVSIALLPAGLVLAIVVGALAFTDLVFDYCAGCQIHALVRRRSRLSA